MVHYCNYFGKGNMAKQTGGRDADRRKDSVFAALDVLPDRWSGLVLREAFFGVRRFSEFRRNLSIARNTLTDRLNRLVEQGVLVKQRVAETNDWEEYRLTEKGLDLYPVVVALMQWGDRWNAPDGPPLLLKHRDCGGQIALELTCKSCAEQPGAREVVYEAGPGS